MAAAKGRTNGFAIGITAAVVAVLIALVGVVVWLNNKATDPGAAPKSAIINSETGAVTTGSGKEKVAVFVDFQCPVCKSFETQFGADLQKLAKEDKITLEYHPIAILDRFSQGTNYSSRAAAASYAVAQENPDKFLDYLNILFENQPTENTPGLTDQQLIDFAKQVGADKAEATIKAGTFFKFPTAQATAHKIQGTPTVEINGERLDLTKQADLAKVAAIAGQK
ncbi:MULTISPECIES: DsbA family protein [unclassified Microbacterium]|uniref:DsbA family protein n=1 Tax=unclassified Microbacterium TaxID=2609290 RepID=UPI00203BE844|nr:thioredoxin domain-containing protein [Microbacterium sp. USTB-Y]